MVYGSSCPMGGSHKPIIDYGRGEMKCSECGLVLEDNIVDQGPEWRTFNEKERRERERVGRPNDPGSHDWGLGTETGRSNNRRKDIKIRSLQSKLRVAARSKRLVTLLSLLHKEAAKLDVPKHGKDTAAMLLRKLSDEGLAKRIEPEALVVAAILYACKVNKIPKSVHDVLGTTGIDKKSLWNAMERISKISKPGASFRPQLRPSEYVPRIVASLSLPDFVITKASEIAESAYQSGILSGRGHLGLSAASVYVISTLLDLKKTQKEIAETLNITEVTIRNRCRDIINSFDITVVL